MHNSITLIGRVGTEIKIYQSEDGKIRTATFRMATSKKWKDKEGIWKEETQWHCIVIAGLSSQGIEERIGKGDMIIVTGELKYREYKKQDVTINIAEIYGSAKRLIKAKDEVQSTVS